MGIRESTWGSLLAVAVGVYAAPLAAADHQDLLELSLEQLMQLEVTDVITHAEKRESYSQNVPFSLSIVEPSNLYSPLLNSTQHVDQRVSGLVVTEYNRVTPQYFIRGIGSNASGSADDPSVAYMLNGINIARPGFHHQQLFDVKQVEVMKGPQGTRYGKGVIGGAVNVVLNRPQAADYRQWFAGVSERGWELQSIANQKLSEELFHRFSLSYSDQDGYVENTFTGTDLGASQELTLRDQWAWQDEKQHINFLFEMNHLDSIDPARVYVGQEPFIPFGGDDLTPHRNDFSTVAMPQDGQTDKRYVLMIFDYQLEQDYGTWVSQTAYLRGDYQFDFSVMPISFIPSTNSADESSWQLTQEIRLQQRWQNWQWHTGVFLSRERVNRQEQANLVGLMNLFGLSGALTPNSPGITDYDSRNDVHNGALFGQVYWSFWPDWNLSLGLRGDYVKKEFALAVSGGDPLGIGLENSADFSERQDQSWTEFSYSIGLDHHLSQQMMVYGLISTGFKSGSLNSLSVSPASALASSQPETALNTELGVKGQFFEKALQCNFSLFQMDYEDLQVYAGFESGANAPEAEIRGAELEMIWKIMEGLELSGNYTYLDTEFEHFLAPVSNDDLAGNRLLRAPTHAVALSLNYSWSDNSQNRYWLTWQGNYQSQMFTEPTNGQDWVIPGYQVSNVSLLLQPAGSDHSLSLWVRNLGDEQYPLHSLGQSGFQYTSQGASWNMAEPRTLGITMNFSL